MDELSGRVFNHIKSGNDYVVVAEATNEADLQSVVVYQGIEHAGRLWVRPRTEFLDGRFIEITKETME